jgi:hypothetical protein
MVDTPSLGQPWRQDVRTIARRQWTGRILRPVESFGPVLWGSRFTLSRPTRLESVELYIGNLRELDELELRLRRVAARPELSILEIASRPEEDGFHRVYALDALLGRERPTIATGVRLPLPQQDAPWSAGCWLFEVIGRQAGKAAPLAVGVASAADPSASPASYFANSMEAPRAAKAGLELAWAVYEESPAATSSASTPPFSSPAGLEPSTLQHGHRVHLPAAVVRRFEDLIHAPEAILEVPPPISVTVKETLKVSAGRGARLRYRHFTNLTTSLPPELLETDSGRGLVRVLHKQDAGVIEVEYTGHECRYDLVSLDPAIGARTLTLGEGRALDPEEYAALASPVGEIPTHALYTTHVGVEIIPVNPSGSLIFPGREAGHLAWIAESRARLPRTLRKLRRGEPILMAGYGDSITALGGRDVAQNTRPDGPLRDRMVYFDAYGDDWKTRVPLFAGPGEAVPTHHRLGWNWTLKAELEAHWGSEITYQNWGIAGTTSGDSKQLVKGDETWNGAYPARLEAMLSESPDLVVVAFGMNDIGESLDSCGAIYSICKAIQASGAEALVVAPCRQNAGFLSRDAALWRWTHDRIVQGAIQAGAAYCPMIPLMGDSARGLLGLSNRSWSAANLRNHPGPREMKAIGRYMAAIFI